MRCEYEPKRDTLITVGFSELKLYHLQNGLVFEMSRRYAIKKHADICDITRFFYENRIQTHLEKFNPACAPLQRKIPWFNLALEERNSWYKCSDYKLKRCLIRYLYNRIQDFLRPPSRLYNVPSSRARISLPIGIILLSGLFLFFFVYIIILLARVLMQSFSYEER